MPTDPSFRMIVQDLFPVRGRGMSAIGDVESGTLTVGDTIWIQRSDSSIRTVVIAIDAYRKQLQQAQKGDSIGAVLLGIEYTEIQRGDVLVGLEPEQSRATWNESDQPVTTYRNDKHDFALDLPLGWSTSSGLSRIPFILSNFINRANILEEFSYHNQEFLNIVVERMQPEIPPEINELVFTLRAQEMNYTDIQFGRIAVAGRMHAWVRYVMNRKGWLKKYMIVLNGYGYALTASCPIERRSPVTEATWDCIATSFRLNKPIDQSVVEYNNSPQVRRSIELLREQLRMQLAGRKRQ